MSLATLTCCIMRPNAVRQLFGCSNRRICDLFINNGCIEWRLVVCRKFSSSKTYASNWFCNSHRKRASKLAFICAGIGAASAVYFGFGWNLRNPGYSANLCAATKPKDVDKSDENSEPNARRIMNFIADIVEKVAPSVVSIETEGSTQTVFGIAQSKGHGSGFIVKENGLILTNAHVVQGNSRLLVTLHDGRKFDGIVEHYDSVTDLATIRIKADNLPVLKLAQSKRARPGEFVIAMGSPLSFANSVTHGVISNTQRRIDINDSIRSEDAFFRLGRKNKRRNMHYIQTDAPITFGNSGGPLINLDGEAVGINNMAVNGIAGISFAIPSDYAVDFLENIEKSTSKKPLFQPLFKRKRLGVTMLTLDPDIIREIRFLSPNFPNIDHGILVHTVEPRSSAQRGGVRPGDIITHVDSEPVYLPEQIMEKLENAASLTLTVLRNSRLETLLIEFDK